ncbi:MAG: hypothetical protein JO091_04925, partial [Acidobacteriaceae bacterium]|nr:hypothetical protein [Acidobacteriaceae bacterium]
LGNDIHSRYLLSFTPDDSGPPRFHHIEVKLRNYPNAVINVRPGYWTGLSTATAE